MLEQVDRTMEAQVACKAAQADPEETMLRSMRCKQEERCRVRESERARSEDLERSRKQEGWLDSCPADCWSLSLRSLVWFTFEIGRTCEWMRVAFELGCAWLK